MTVLVVTDMQFANLANGRDLRVWNLCRELAKLDRAQFPKADLRRARFGQSCARWVDFSYAKLELADFTDANLEGSVMHAVTIEGASFKGANHANVSGTDEKRLQGETFGARRG